MFYFLTRKYLLYLLHQVLDTGSLILCYPRIRFNTQQPDTRRKPTYLCRYQQANAIQILQNRMIRTRRVHFIFKLSSLRLKRLSNMLELKLLHLFWNRSLRFEHNSFPPFVFHNHCLTVQLCHFPWFLHWSSILARHLWSFMKNHFILHRDMTILKKSTNFLILIIMTLAYFTTIHLLKTSYAPCFDLTLISGYKKTNLTHFFKTSFWFRWT